jgi:phage repressor protein C with HTH and peptisase S24 domain
VSVAGNYLGDSLAGMVDAGRLKKRMEDVRMSQAELARRVGISQTAVQKLTSGAAYNSRYLHKIARELGTTPAFLTGEIDDPSEGALPAPKAQDIAEQLDAVLVPQVEIGLSMGGGALIDDWPVVQQVPMSRSWLRSLTPSSPEHLMIAPGVGDSMMPTILDGDLTIIDRAQNTPRQQDRIWALTYGGWGMIKRLRALPDGTLQINSDNPSVSPIIAYEGEAQIIGRVVGVVRRI